MPAYTLKIFVRAYDQATGPLGRLRRAFRRLAWIAGGILIAGTIRSIADKIRDVGVASFEAYTRLERMQIGLESLVARELSMAKPVETTITSIKNLTDTEILQMDKLRVSVFDLGEELAELNEDHQEAIDEFGTGSVEALRYSIAIREVTAELEKTSKEYETLAALQGAVVATTTTHLAQTIGLKEALKQARAPAERLTRWVVRLSLTSPFTEDDITQVLRLAAGYGFVTQAFASAGSEEAMLAAAQASGVVTAQRFTKAMLDFVAALGLTSEDLVRVVRGIAQVQAKGKLAGEEIRQLTNAGVGVELMARAMGMTVTEFTNLQKEGKILAKDFIPGLIELIESDLTGAAERMALTLGGTVTNLKKVGEVILRTFFGPTFKALTPFLRELFTDLSSDENLANVAAFGEKFQESLSNAYGWVITLQGAISRTKDFFKNPWEIVLAASPKDWDAALKRQIVEAIQSIPGEIAKLDLSLGELGFESPQGAKEGALKGLLAAGTLGTILKYGGAIIGLLLSIVTGVGWVGVAVAGLGAIWGGNFLNIQEKTREAWEDHIKPAFEGIYKWAQEEIPRAIETLVDWFTNTFRPEIEEVANFITNTVVPAFKEVWRIINEDVVPAVKEWWFWLSTFLLPKLTELVGVIRDEVKTEIKSFSDMINPNVHDSNPSLLKRWVEVFTDDVYPTLIGFASTILGAVVPAQLALNTTLAAFINDVIGPGTPTWEYWNQLVMSAGLVWEDLRDAAGSVLGIFATLIGIGARLFGLIFAAVGMPILTALKDLWVDHLNPAVSALVGLLTDVYNIGASLFVGLVTFFILPAIRNWSENLKKNLNKALQKMSEWLHKLRTEDLSSSKWGAAIGMFLTHVVGILTQGFDNIAKAIDAVTTAISNLRIALQGLAQENLPWWAVGHSPPPAERWFLGIASGLSTMNNALLGVDLDRLDKVSFRQQSFAGVGQLQPSAPPVQEGDRFNINNYDQGSAAVMSAWIEMRRRERINDWMG